MANSKELKIVIAGDASKLNKTFAQTSKQAGHFGDRMAKVGKVVALGLGGLAVGAAVAGKRMIDMASDAAEVQSKMQVVFGRQLPALTKNIDKFSQATGTSRFEMREQAADMGALLEPLTANKKEASDMSLQFVKLATDLGSFNNVPTADALLAIRSGLVGEAEPLRRFGVLLNEAAVKQEGLRLGLVKGKQEMTEQQKVQARASLIMQQTTLAQGDATRTADSMANQMKRLRTEISDTATEIGMALLPAALAVVSTFNAHWPTIKRVATAVFDALGKGIAATVGFFRTNWATITMVSQRSLETIQRVAEVVWPKVQAAASRTMVWYRDHLLPTLISVSNNISLAWNKMLTKTQRDADGNMSATQSIFSHRLQNIVALVNALLATLRGDWGEALHQMRVAVVENFKVIVGIIKGFWSIVFNAAKSIGEALTKGVIAGIGDIGKAIYDKAAGGLMGAVGSLQKLGRIHSPSGLMADEIGEPLALGIGMGFINGMKKVNAVMLAELTATGRQLAAIAERRAAEDRSAAVRDASAALAEARKKKEGVIAAEQALARAREDVVVAGLEKTLAREQAIYDKRQALIQAKMDKLNAAIQKAQDKAAAIFDRMRSKIMTAFEAVRGNIKTPAEEALDALNESATQRDLQKALADAIAGGDQEAILRAQEDIQRDSLERQAATERTALDQQTEALREKLQDRLDVWKGGTSGILEMLKGFGIDFQTVGALLGTAFRDSLIASIKGTNTAVGAGGVSGGGGGQRAMAAGVGVGQPIVFQTYLDGKLVAESVRRNNTIYQSNNAGLRAI